MFTLLNVMVVPTGGTVNGVLGDPGRSGGERGLLVSEI